MCIRDRQEFARIQDALVDYPGFDYQKSSIRTYSAPTLAHALGYVSEISKKQLDNQDYPYYRQGDLVGQSGLEKFYEEQLRGRRGVRYVMPVSYTHLDVYKRQLRTAPPTPAAALFPAKTLLVAFNVVSEM